ncbi:(-)-germacrene D synthase [Linum grandiflorum]
MLLTKSDIKLSEKLKLIDVVERLGIGYHFEEEIDDQLRQMSNVIDDDDGIFTVALHFRLLRQHGYHVPADAFEKLKDEEGNFKKELKDDVEGMLSLYEASYLRMHGEDILDEAIEHMTAEFKSMAGELASPLSERVAHALKRPLRKGVDKHEQLFFISLYDQDVGHDRTLLKLAKLSWNVLQHMYQHELKALTKWWIDLDFAAKLDFARDRLIEIYFWAVGAMWEPKFSLSRYYVTKIMTLASVTDDIYDVYGTINELEMFTAAALRWDTSMKGLPEYMVVFYEAVIDVLEEIGEISAKEGRSYCLDYGKLAEKNQLKAYLQEARWFAENHVPTVEEYRRVGVYSCAYPLLTYSVFCGMGDKAPKELFEWLLADPKILVATSDLCRIMDDIVSHEFEQERGHVASSVECYMKQYGVSRDEAVVVLNGMVEDDWKDINEECIVIGSDKLAVSKEVLSVFVGLAKVMDVLYKDSDGYTFSSTDTKNMMTALLVTPM